MPWPPQKPNSYNPKLEAIVAENIKARWAKRPMDVRMRPMDNKYGSVEEAIREALKRRRKR